MRLNEKWTLFLIATFVTFFGIVDTLLKKTVASDPIIDNGTNLAVKDTNENEYDNNKVNGVYTVDNCLYSIEFSEGSINFKSQITEYWIDVTNFEYLKVSPKLHDNSFSYSVEKIVENSNKIIVIRIMDNEFNIKKYMVYVNELSNDN